MKNLFLPGILVVVLVLVSACATNKEHNAKPNVLMLYMDDLRPQLGCYGNAQTLSPNIDALANNGVIFTNAYCNVAVCGASRASMLTGMRPTKTRFRDYKTFVQDDTPEAITLPQLFRNNDYTTISNGKIYHHLDDRMSDWDEVWRPYAFEKNPEGLAPTDWWQSLWRDYMLPENISVYKTTDRGPAFESANVPDTAYIDGLMAQKVIRDLEKLKKQDEPFFLTAGFISPHLPFNAPSRHWNKYNRQDIKQPYNNFIPENAPLLSISKSNELRQYTGIPPKGEQVSDSIAISLIHGYYATVSYVDALIGTILAKLTELGLEENTIVVLVSDHGFNLQEHTQWAKWTSHRTSMQVPLIISSPFFKHKHTTDALVELVDIYPTLAELCGLPMPENQLEGASLLPILNGEELKGKDHVFINNSNGYTVKTADYCYTEFINPKNNEMYARTLYDHVKDPDENRNVAEDKAYKEVVAHMHGILHNAYKENVYGK
ncbi:sulfatase [Carboxylicivirga marina]|uniref:sulfatase n=1 Tax=Carboxylicivirga marina TaxID=2800988 RepID=UPI0025997CA0|nr:sulfatase [uncultured Carboxylicivirga sp.]